jgi:hypothetical protein
MWLLIGQLLSLSTGEWRGAARNIYASRAVDRLSGLGRGGKLVGFP